MFKIVSEIESIADSSLNVAKAVGRRNEQNVEFPEFIDEKLQHMMAIVDEHLLFHTLQNGSRHAFNAEWNAPLPIIADSIASADNLIPDYYPRPIPRLVSCYALFK